MILVLALLCAVPVGAETETVVSAALQTRMYEAAADDKLPISIWLPQANWGTGEGISQYVGKIVTENRIYGNLDNGAIYDFLNRERAAEELTQHADAVWFAETYGLTSYRLFSDVFLDDLHVLLVEMTAEEIQALAAKHPDAYVTCRDMGMSVERHMAHNGDANEDEVMDSSDVRLVLQYAVGKVTHPRFINVHAADINGDNTVDSADARQILQKAVGK